MKKYFLLSIISMLLCMTAHAQDYFQGFYVGALVGPNFEHYENQFMTHIKTKTGFGASGLLGYRFCPCARVELELGYRYQPLKELRVRYRSRYDHGYIRFRGGHKQSTLLLANFIYDFNNNTCWTPYLGIGLGYAHVEAKSRYNYYSSKHTQNEVASQAIAGVFYQINSSLALGLDYRVMFMQEKNYNHFVSLCLTRELY